MKTRILSVLAAVAAFLTAIGGLDLSGMISLLPDTVATGFAVALPLLAGVVHLIKAVGDFIDDGSINGSFKLLALFLVCTACLALCSCAGLAGTSFTFDEAGNVVVTPPPTPIVILLESGK